MLLMLLQIDHKPEGTRVSEALRRSGELGSHYLLIGPTYEDEEHRIHIMLKHTMSSCSGVTGERWGERWVHGFTRHKSNWRAKVEHKKN